MMLLNTEIKKSLVIIKVLQDLLFLLILYFFYTVELLDSCNNSNKRLNINIFINNIILLVYRFFIKINCHMLT